MTPRLWLNALLAGLFALAVVAAPAEHARSVVARAGLNTAHPMPDGAMPGTHGGHAGHAGGHGEHLNLPACFACILMAAPGLPVPAGGLPTCPTDKAPAESFEGRSLVTARATEWRPCHPRAPPFEPTA